MVAPVAHLLDGLPATGALTFGVPIGVFAFLFGLAIDYEVFIFARMREAYDDTHDTSTAVIDGIGRTGRLLTSAALILTLAFVALSTAPLTFLKVLASGSRRPLCLLSTAQTLNHPRVWTRKELRAQIQLLDGPWAP